MQLLKAKHHYIAYHVGAIILVLIIGALMTTSTYFHYDNLQRTQILQNASMLAASFDPNRILSLAGTEEDFSNPDYLFLKSKLIKIREANPNVRFVYLAGYRDGQPFFFADSEPDDSEDSSPPGQIYTEADEGFSMPFFTGQAIIDGIYPDRWGLFLTALAPIFDPTDPKKVIAEVGIDEDASNRTLLLLVNSSPAMFPALFFCIIILINFILKRHEEHIKQVREDFSSMMVHELRSPLDNIKKISELLLQEKPIGSGGQYLHSVLQDSSRMLELINDLLDIAKLEAGKFQINKRPSDITEIIRERVNFFGVSAQFSKVDLKTFIDPGIPKNISIDPIRISQVLNNLISNAIKFTPKNNAVSIQALIHTRGQKLEDEAKTVGITWFLNSAIENISTAPNSLVVAVTDMGPGISKENTRQLFSKFKQVKGGTKKGTGLGLVVIKGIINAHGGVASVVSKQGQGSSFYFILPL